MLNHLMDLGPNRAAMRVALGFYTWGGYGGCGG
jgi:hypothetical protein